MTPNLSSGHRTAATAAALLAVVLTLVLSGCGTGPSGAGTQADTGPPVRGGTLRFGVLDAPANLDPHSATSYPESIIADNITDKLTWQDPKTGDLHPWLATSWSYNPALTEFTFHLRNDVTFSDGTKFDSSSVKANFDQNAVGDGALQIVPDPVHYSGYVTTDTPDPYTAVVRFSRPSASFLQFTSSTGNNAPGFVAASTLAKSKTQRQDPRVLIGTGSFVIKSFAYQQNVVLAKRAGYHWAPEALHHDGDAYLDEIDIQTIPESTVRTGALQSGDLDATLDVQPTDERLLARSGFQILAQTVPGTTISFNLNAGFAPTDDVAVRKALSLGWDRNSLKKAVLTGSYAVATSVLGSKVPGYADYSTGSLRYDQAAARALLDQDGWVPGPDGLRSKNGAPLTLKLLGISNLVANQPSYQLMQQQLRQIGVDAQLSVLPIADFTVERTKAATTYHGVAANTSRDDPSVLWQAYSPDVSNSSYVTPGDPNRGRLVDTLQKINETLDPAQRDAVSRTAQDLLVDDLALTVPVYEPAQVIAAAPGVHGIVFDAQSRNLFYGTWISR